MASSIFRQLLLVPKVALVASILAMSLIAPSASGSSVISVMEIDPDEQKRHAQKMRREWRPKCRKVWAKRNNLGKVYESQRFSRETLLEVANLLSTGLHGCRNSPELALKILEDLEGKNLIAASADNLTEMIQLYDEVQPTDYRSRIVELRRVLWVRGSSHNNHYQMEWDDAGWQAFVARDDIWAYLIQNPKKYSNSHHIIRAYFSPISPRYAPAKAVELALSDKPRFGQFLLTAIEHLLVGKGIPKDVARAEEELWDIAEYNDQARFKLFPLVTPKLNSANSSEAKKAADALYKIATGRYAKANWQSKAEGAAAMRESLIPFYAQRLQNRDITMSIDAAQHLSTLVTFGTLAAMEPLGPWIDKELSGDNTYEKLATWQILSALIRSGVSIADPLLAADIKRTGGVIEVDHRTALRRSTYQFVTSNDYPTRSLMR